MTRTIRTISLAMALAASAPAAAGPFEDFFRASGESAENAVRSKSPPQVYTSNDLNADVRRLLEDGYFVIGVSSWVGTPEDAKKTAKFAKKVRASIALVNYRYIDTVSGGTQVVMMPVIGGYGGMIGGSRPISFDRYEQTTYFLAKLKPEVARLGIYSEPLTRLQAQAVGTARGVAITLVVRASPAFDAGVLSGDIILTLAGRDISTADRLERVKTDFAGQTVPVEIYRDGHVRTLQITMPLGAVAQVKK